MNEISQLFSERDKRWHMGISAGIAHLLIIFMWIGGNDYSTVTAFMMVLILGVMKEVNDENTMREHVRDMIANAIGASTVFLWILV